jgi:hypothetical protein
MKQSELEANNKIPYKYIDADNKIYKDSYLNNNEDSSIEISAKHSNDISKIDPKKLSEDELCKLIEDKDTVLIELNQKRETLKTELTTNIQRLNDIITENAELLYKKSPNPSEIKWLTEQYNTKKKTLDIEKKINHSYKVQYNILENKMKSRNSNLNSKNNTNSDNEINGKSLKMSNKSTKVSNNLYMSLEDQINKIKNENKDMVIKINNIKNRKVSQKREMDSILNGELNSQLEQKCEDLQKLKSLKYEAEEKFNTSNRALEMMNKKVDNFEQKIKQIDVDEYDVDNYSLNICNFWLSLVKEELDNKNPDELVELIRNDQSKFMNELNKKKVVLKKKKKKTFQDGGTDMTSNNPNGINETNNNIITRDNKNNNNKKQNKDINKNKNIFAIFSILNNSININNDSKLNNNIKNENDKLLKLKEDKNILNDITDIEYRQLLNKKEEYLEKNMRLDKNLKDFSKTEQAKLSKVAKSIKEKDIQLKITKEKNELIQEEVNNLENIYQLSLEKEKISKEIAQKMNISANKTNDNKDNNIKVEINNSLISKNNNINQDIKTKMEDNNNSDSLYKLNIKKKNRELILNNEKKSDFPETREEQLKLIRKKYLEEEEQEQKNKNINNMEEITNEQFIDSENNLNEIENQEQDQINNEYNYNNIEIKNNYEEENDIDIINDNISNNNNKINDENIDEIDHKNIKKKKAPFKV